MINQPIYVSLNINETRLEQIVQLMIDEITVGRLEYSDVETILNKLTDEYVTITPVFGS